MTIRKVERVETIEGAYGSTFWRLFLACGHTVLQPSKKEGDLERGLSGLRRATGRPPASVRCASCGAVARWSSREARP